MAAVASQLSVLSTSAQVCGSRELQQGRAPSALHFQAAPVRIGGQRRASRRAGSLLSVRAAADGAQTGVASELVAEVGVDTFYPALDAAGNKLVVLDMYTQWCGPCKLIAPKFEALAKEMGDVVFLRLDCNQENKPLAKALGVKVVPTFKFFKGKELKGEVQGAKYDAVVAEIQKLR